MQFPPKIPLSHLPGLYLTPSKSMWQPKSAIGKKVFFCPHVKQTQRLTETVSFRASAASCSTWCIFGGPLWRCQPAWDDRQSRRHVAGNQALQCDFDVRVFLGFALKRPVQKFQCQNMSTIISVSCPDMENHPTFCFCRCGTNDCQGRH